ncbi:MAG: CDP-diacylglycerol--glycerol-3-phosphate 3-phosphatidyltransferase [Candidatus Omnitrophota bacterium]|nr:CDP-diacylglycerol--glycerol-3-phosphate 3-phosphatidyltransferase [Candidatus Omnitrophota bacterium]MDZ4242940.1 CDP-diacylglycerol--glycerol-3-phosphate 3-phosphatidyltransferase [Candidatus Omnitrophota bacterium]
MNFPNALTMSRILLTVVFIFALDRSGLTAAVLATAAFMTASWTDFYDGYYAKKYNQVSNFGKILDPIADKFLVLSAFYIFSGRQLIPAWMFAVIFVREVAVTASRLAAMNRKGRVLAAEKAGKCKTVAQLFGILLILILLMSREAGLFGRLSPSWQTGCLRGIDVFMFLTVGLTVVSGVMYFWNNRRVVFFNGLTS